MTYEQQVWRRAMLDAEADVMRFLPTITGGRLPGETIEKYFERCQGLLQEALDNLAIARGNFNAASKETK